MTIETCEQTVARFKCVVAARKTIRDLLGLFHSLTVSTKFEDSHKHACFVYLLTECTKRVPDANVMQLLTAVENSDCCKRIHETYSYDDIEKIIGQLVRRVVQVTPHETKAMIALFSRLRFNGTNRGRIYTICMCLAAGMSVDEVDPLCTLTEDQDYYIDHGHLIEHHPA